MDKMGTTAEKLQAILNSKAAIKSAIEEKGQIVGNIPLNKYAEKILAIQTFGAEVLNINLKTNQPNSPVHTSGIQVVIKYGTETITRKWAGVELSEKVPAWVPVEVSVIGEMDQYRTPDKQSFIASRDNIRPILFTYETELLTVFLFAEGATSCEGQIITINGKEYTREPISAYIPFGTSYYISVNSKAGYISPDTEYFTANQADRTVSMTYLKDKRSIFILDTSGNLVKRADWNTSNNSKAVGVAVLSDNCKFVISPSESSSGILWGGYGTTINDIVTTNNTVTAKRDYTGSGNTDKIIAQLGSGNAPAANYCRSVTFKHGKKGYLGALGEWQEAYNNKAEIDACMSLIGGADIDIGIYYCTSTQCDREYSWVLSWLDFKANGNDKRSYFRVRAFSAL